MGRTRRGPANSSGASTPRISARIATSAIGRSCRQILATLLQDPGQILSQAEAPERRGLLRANTERAIELGIFGAPNCLVAGELFWGEEALDDAIAWARR